jgi:hypothetical protein
MLTVNAMPAKGALECYLLHVNNSHQHVEFVISVISNVILSCWFHDGVYLNNGITHIVFGMRCPISNNGFAIGIGYLINFTDCVLDITGFIFRLSTQGKARH